LIVLIVLKTVIKAGSAKSKCIWCSCLHPTTVLLLFICSGNEIADLKSHIIVCIFIIFIHTHYFLYTNMADWWHPISQ